MSNNIYKEATQDTFSQLDYCDHSAISSAVSRTSQDDNLSELTTMLAVQMAPNQLKDALRSGNREMLAETIRKTDRLGTEVLQKYEKSSGENVCLLLRNAKQKLAKIQELENELSRACSSEKKASISNIQQVLRRIDDSGLAVFLRQEVKDAVKLLEQLQPPRKAPPILAMDKRTMTEIKHYANPSPLVHTVMQASLLLLGVDEDRTSMWSQCQTLCTPDGPQGLNRRLMQFNVERVKPFIAIRVRLMLKPIKLADIQKASPGAATFFVWAKGALQEWEQLNGGVEYDKQFLEELEGKTADHMSKIIRREKKIFMQAERNEKDDQYLQSPRRTMNPYL